MSAEFKAGGRYALEKAARVAYKQAEKHEQAGDHEESEEWAARGDWLSGRSQRYAP